MVEGLNENVTVGAFGGVDVVWSGPAEGEALLLLDVGAALAAP